MAFWNKKEVRTKVVEKDPVVEIPVPKCIHTWKDFPAYIKERYTGPKQESVLEVVEPYVCVHCKERKNVTLYTETETGLTRDEHNEKRAYWERKYREILKPRIVVEDMINDEIYVDPVKLAIVDKLRSAKDETKEDTPELSVQPQRRQVEVVSTPPTKIHKTDWQYLARRDNEGKVRVDIL